MCTIINNEGDLGWAEDIDGETNDKHKGHEILSMISLLVLSACITFRNFYFPFCNQIEPQVREANMFSQVFAFLG